MRVAGVSVPSGGAGAPRGSKVCSVGAVALEPRSA